MIFPLRTRCLICGVLLWAGAAAAQTAQSPEVVKNDRLQQVLDALSDDRPDIYQGAIETWAQEAPRDKEIIGIVKTEAETLAHVEDPKKRDELLQAFIASHHLNERTAAPPPMPAAGPPTAGAGPKNEEVFSNKSPLLDAIKQNDQAKIERLFNEQMELKSRPGGAAIAMPPLTAAALAGNEDLARFFISRGADVNAKDAQGRTPLMAAAYAKSVDVVNVLVKFNADVNARDADHKSALDFADKAGDREIVQTLQDAGAQP